MAYEPKLNWADGMSVEAADMTRIEQGVKDAHTMLEDGAAGFSRKQATNMAKALSKLKQGKEAISVAFRGDSVWYAFDGLNELGNRVMEDCIPDIGSPLSGFGRRPQTIYDAFRDLMNDYYNDKVTIKKQIYTGDIVYGSFFRFNPSKSDFILINYGINDCMGSHIDDSYTDGISTEIPKPYKGNVAYFMEGYRKVIEKELNAGTAVILVSPTKCTLRVEGVMPDGRTLLDVYRQAVHQLGIEYGCPVIDGLELTKNIDNTTFMDMCHFTDAGFKAIGHRLAAWFIGGSPMVPHVVHSNEYIGVDPYIEDCMITAPSVFDSTDKSPNFPMVMRSEDLYVAVDRMTGGLQANVSDKGKIVWSFYCPQDGMVVIPSFYTEDPIKIRMMLDGGSQQGKWANMWDVVGIDGTIDRSYEEPSTIIYEQTDLITSGIGKIYAPQKVTTASQKVMKITSKGWHTLEIGVNPNPKPSRDGEIMPMSDIPESFDSGTIQVYGLTFYSLEDYKKKING